MVISMQYHHCPETPKVYEISINKKGPKIGRLLIIRFPRWHQLLKRTHNDRNKSVMVEHLKQTPIVINKCRFILFHKGTKPPLFVLHRVATTTFCLSHIDTRCTLPYNMSYMEQVYQIATFVILGG